MPTKAKASTTASLLCSYVVNNDTIAGYQIVTADGNNVTGVQRPGSVRADLLQPVRSKWGRAPGPAVCLAQGARVAQRQWGRCRLRAGTPGRPLSVHPACPSFL